jgi:cupin fold WbuC family metalloprotein
MFPKNTNGKSTAFFHTDDIFTLDHQSIIQLKDAVKHDLLGRARICLHRVHTDLVQEMVIVMEKRTYIRPHKHIGMFESFHIIEGTLRLVFFDDFGNIIRQIDMAAIGHNKPFIYRLSQNYFHCVIITSKQVLFHETCAGPFTPNSIVYAGWSPKENDSRSIRTFMEKIEKTPVKTF